MTTKILLLRSVTVCAFFLLLGVPHTLMAQCTYQPGPDAVDDASLNGWSGGRDQNEPDDLWVFTSDGLHGQRRGVIRFRDLSSLPYPASSVVLQVWGVPRDPNTPKRGDVSAYQVLEDWDETTVTYNNQPAHDPVPIGTVTPDIERWYEWDITALYNDWRSGVAENFGLMLINSHQSTPATGIITEGSDGPDPDRRPRLQFEDDCTGDNLIACWKLDEGTGAVAYDSAGGWHGNLTGQTPPTWVPGVIGNALRFDGDDHVLTTFNPDVAIGDGNSYTKAFWFNQGTAPCRQGIVVVPLHPRFYFVRDYNCEYRVGVGSQYTTTFDLPNPALDTWSHVTVVFDATQSEIHVYQNGIAFFTHSYTGDGDMPNGNFQLSEQSSLNNPFTGMLDEVAIYNRALTPEEVLDGPLS